MLTQTPAMATVAVKDIQKAEEFYVHSLGLQKSSEKSEPRTLMFDCGSSRLLVYESQYAGTNQATAVSWFVESTDREVEALRAKGVTFEHYQLPQLKLEGDVHVGGGLRLAWFKDPDGNIHGLLSQEDGRSRVA